MTDYIIEIVINQCVLMFAVIMVSFACVYALEKFIRFGVNIFKKRDVK